MSGTAPCRSRRGSCHGTSRPATGRRGRPAPCRPDPTAPFRRRQHRHEDAGLGSAEDAALANLLEEAMDVEGALAADPLPEALDHLVRPRDRVDAFAAAPDALVRVDLHEQASADVAALQVGDAQRRRRGRLSGVVDRLPIDGKRAGGSGAGHGSAGGQESATIARLYLSSDQRSPT